MAKKKVEPAPEPTPPLRLEWRSPAELAENPRNWRTHPAGQVAALTDVLTEVGWAGACLLNERTGHMIDGHARKKVALEQGTDRVPVLVGSWTEEQEAKILATLDPLGAMATADAAKLDALLREVQTGSEALAGMLTELAEANPLEPSLPAPGGGGDEFDATPAEGPTRCQAGDLWVIGGVHRLLVGDCTDAGNVARLMGGETPFLLVTDPPYGVEYEPGWRDGIVGEFGAHSCVGTKLANDDRCDWSEAFALSKANVAYIWHASWFIADVQRSIIEAGYLPRSLVIWVKQHFAVGRSHYQWQHEPCWYAFRKGAASARWCGDRTQSTIWEISSLNPAGRKEEREAHGTQKPVECMARPIRNHGEPGDIVYDPFLGSGTTLIAAHRLGRRCFGLELECRYGDVILKRAEAEGLTCERVEP